MIDLFVLLTPILLLGVVALLGFAGCGFHPERGRRTDLHLAHVRVEFGRHGRNHY